MLLPCCLTPPYGHHATMDTISWSPPGGVTTSPHTMTLHWGLGARFNQCQWDLEIIALCSLHVRASNMNERNPLGLYLIERLSLSFNSDEEGWRRKWLLGVWRGVTVTVPSQDCATPPQPVWKYHSAQASSGAWPGQRAGEVVIKIIFSQPKSSSQQSSNHKYGNIAVVYRKGLSVQLIL